MPKKLPIEIADDRLLAAVAELKAAQANFSNVYRSAGGPRPKVLEETLNEALDEYLDVLHKARSGYYA